MITQQNRLHGCLTSQIGQFYYTTNKIKETNAYVLCNMYHFNASMRDTRTLGQRSICYRVEG